MKAVIKIAINNIKKKKLQSILVLLTISIAAMLYSTSLNLMFSIDKPFQETHDRLNGFDNLIYINPVKEDVEKLVELFKNDKGVKEVEVGNSYSTNNYAKVNGKQIKYPYRIEEKEDKNKGIDRLLTLSGDNGISPKKGEVWISKDIADNSGIKLNDTIEFNIDDKAVTQKVGALVVDPGLGSSSLGICRFWVCKDGLADIVPKNEMIKNVSIVFNECGDGDATNLNVEKTLGRPIIGYNFKYSLIKYANTVMFKIISRVLLIIAIFILLFTFLIIMIIISNSIFNDFKNIGIESSIGFTKYQIILNYIVQFIMLSSAASVIGVIIGTELSKLFLGKFYSSLGFSQVSLPIYLSSIITVLTILMFVCLFSAVSSLTIFKISPVEAMKSGSSPVKSTSRSSISLMFMKKLDLSFSLSIKSILNNKRQNVLLFLLISAAIYITVFCINIRGGLRDIGKNAAYWGMENSDISLIVKAEKNSVEVANDMENIRKDSRVALVSNFYSYASISVPKTDKIPSESIIAVVYDTDFDNMGLENIIGKNPRSNDEISISDKVSEKYNKNLGDYFTMYISGKKKTFLIVGIYQSIFHAGESIRLKEDIISNIDPAFKNVVPTQSSILVNNRKDIPNLLSDLKKQYGNAYEVNEGNQYITNFTKSELSSVNVFLLIIIGSFMFVAVFCIFNLNLINIYGYKKDLGIYKSLGFTDLGIVKVYVYKILLLFIISILVTIPLASFTQGNLFSNLLKGMGIRSLPLNMYTSEISISLSLFVIMIAAVVIISCRAIANINGRELISE